MKYITNEQLELIKKNAQELIEFSIGAKRLTPYDFRASAIKAATDVGILADELMDSLSARDLEEAAANAISRSLSDVCRDGVEL